MGPALQSPSATRGQAEGEKKKPADRIAAGGRNFVIRVRRSGYPAVVEWGPGVLPGSNVDGPFNVTPCIYC